jgi:predicted RNA-binding Zn ribbon-like protein
MPALWIDFVNSHARDYRGRGQDQDHLIDPAWIRGLLERWRLGAADRREPVDAAALRALRSALQRMVRALVAGKPPARRDLAALNRPLSVPAAQVRIAAGPPAKLEIRACDAGATGRLAFAVALSFAEFLVSGRHDRLRLCDNHDCQWVFLDETRSGTRRWCAQTCGNLIKVRRFRQQRRAP